MQNMSKKVLIIESSPRENSNSSFLASCFANGAMEAGHEVKTISIGKTGLKPCLACYACTKIGHCVQDDGVNDILPLLLKADVILFASPVYFYSMSGQLKCLIDRTVGIYEKIRSDIYIILTAWDPEKSHLHNALEAIRGFTRDCLEDCLEKGYILAAGLNDQGEAKDSEYAKVAYEMGRSC